jgi:hypothetical protein
VSAQDLLAYALVGAAAAWLVVRLVARRRRRTCCGERECPAARRMAARLAEAGAAEPPGA